MKLIAEWRKAYKLYSVHTFVAIILVSIADVVVSLFHPTSILMGIFLGALSGVLGVAGIVLRTIKQRPIHAPSKDSPCPPGPAD